MIKVTMFTVFATITVLCSSFNSIDKTATIVSEDLESALERKMLNSVQYIEEHEEVDLGFDPYFYLPDNFNPYKGMHFELDEIEYIEVEKELL